MANVGSAGAVVICDAVGVGVGVGVGVIGVVPGIRIFCS